MEAGWISTEMIAGVSPGGVLLAVVIAAVAGCVRGFSGFGFVLVAAPLFAIWLPPAVFVPLVLLLDVAGSLAVVPRVWRQVRWRLIPWLLVPSLAVIPAGVWLLTAAPEGLLRVALALTVIAGVVILVFLRPRRTPPTRRGAMLAGSASGLLNGALGAGGPPIALYGLASDLPRAAIRATALAYFLFADGFAIALQLASIEDTAQPLVLAAAALPALIAGQALGGAWFVRSSDARFRQVGAAILFVSGGVLLVREAAALIF